MTETRTDAQPCNAKLFWGPCKVYSRGALRFARIPKPAEVSLQCRLRRRRNLAGLVRVIDDAERGPAAAHAARATVLAARNAPIVVLLLVRGAERFRLAHALLSWRRRGVSHVESVVGGFLVRRLVAECDLCSIRVQGRVKTRDLHEN